MKKFEQKAVLCPKGGFHSDEQIKLLCLEQCCRSDNLCCIICKKEKHQNHKTVLIKQFFQDINYKSKQQEKNKQINFQQTLEETQESVEASFQSFKKYIILKLNKFEQKMNSYFNSVKKQNQEYRGIDLSVLQNETDPHILQQSINEMLDKVLINKDNSNRVSEIDLNYFTSQKLKQGYHNYALNFVHSLKRMHQQVSNEYKQLMLFQNDGQEKVANLINNSILNNNTLNVSFSKLTPNQTQDSFFPKHNYSKSQTQSQYQSLQQSQFLQQQQLNQQYQSQQTINGNQQQQPNLNEFEDVSPIPNVNSYPQPNSFNQQFQFTQSSSGFFQPQNGENSTKSLNNNQQNQFQFQQQNQQNQQNQQKPVIFQRSNSNFNSLNCDQNFNDNNNNSINYNNNYNNSFNYNNNNNQNQNNISINNNDSNYNSQIINNNSQSLRQSQMNFYRSGSRMTPNESFIAAQGLQRTQSLIKDSRHSSAIPQNLYNNKREEKLRQPIDPNKHVNSVLQFKFSTQLKHSHIDVIRHKQVARACGDFNDTRMILLEPAAETRPLREISLTFHIISCKDMPYSGPIAIGLCHQKQLENNNYSFIGDDVNKTNYTSISPNTYQHSKSITSFTSGRLQNTSSYREANNHGCYMVSANGIIRHSKDSQQDMKKGKCRFKKGDLIKMDWNPFKKTLTFTRLGTSDITILNDVSPTTDKLYPCVRLSYQTDQVAIQNY